MKNVKLILWTFFVNGSLDPLIKKKKPAYLQSLCYFGAKATIRAQWMVTPSPLKTRVGKRGKFNQKDWFGLWFWLAKRQQGRQSFKILTKCKNEKRQKSKTSLQLFRCKITIKELYLYKNYSTVQLLVFFLIYIKKFSLLQIFVSRPNWYKDLFTINCRSSSILHYYLFHYSQLKATTT